MTPHVLQFVEFSDQDRKAAKSLGKLGKGDQVEVRVRRKSGGDQVVLLPLKAAALLETALSRLLTEDQELSPNDAAEVLGISRRWWSIALISAICRSGMWASMSHETHGRAGIEGGDGRPAAGDGGARRGRRRPQATLWCLSLRSRFSTPASSILSISETSSSRLL